MLVVAPAGSSGRCSTRPALAASVGRGHRDDRRGAAVPAAGGLKSGRFLLSWNEAAAIRWDVLILFGGGLALAAAIGDSDLAAGSARS